MMLANVNDCTGCGACCNICPVSAISMLSDAEGFLQPNIDKEKCVGCAKCEKTCPIVSKIRIPLQIEKAPVCGCTRSDKIWKMSTSGGAFSEICLSLRGLNPVVFGARFDGLYKVCHDRVEGVDNIAPFCKSKYVQSEIGQSLKKCRDYLDLGRTVIFSGSPCQIAGLRGFLGNEYENLITVEFICHGAASPSVFRAFLREIEGACGEGLVSYEFRHKVGDNASANVYNSLARLKSGKTQVVEFDTYNRLFIKQLILRRSCGVRCRFRNQNRVADITLADSRGEGKLFKKMDARNWSVIIPNTVKGKNVVDEMMQRMETRPYPLSVLRETNPLYFTTNPENPLRNKFFGYYLQKVPIEEIARRMGVRMPLWKKIIRKAHCIVKDLL